MLLLGCALDPLLSVAGTSSAPVFQDRELDGFSQIRTAGSVDVEVTVGPRASVRVEAPTEYLDSVLTRVVDGSLVLDSESGVYINVRRRIHVTMPRIDRLDAESSADVAVSGLAGGVLRPLGAFRLQALAQRLRSSMHARGGSPVARANAGPGRRCEGFHRRAAAAPPGHLRAAPLLC